LHRRSLVEIVDFSEDDNDSIKTCCKNCLKFGFMVQLKNRIYPDNEPILVDHDQWRQCMECGTIVPVYEIEKESSIKEVVETTDSPFDIAKNSFLGVDNRTSIGGKNVRKKNEMFADINDPDLKRELASGQTRLISYTQS
jgi:hypothetical protein